jgi:hypothetical protein
LPTFRDENTEVGIRGSNMSLRPHLWGDSVSLHKLPSVTLFSVSRSCWQSLLLSAAVSRYCITFSRAPYSEIWLYTHIGGGGCEAQMSHATTQITGGRPTEMTQHLKTDKHAEKLLMSFGCLPIQTLCSK